MNPLLVSGIVNVAGNVLDRVLPARQPAAAPAPAQNFDALIQAATAEKIRASLSAAAVQTPSAADRIHSLWQSPKVGEITERTGVAPAALEINAAGSLTARMPDGSTEPVIVSPEFRQTLLEIRRLSAASDTAPLVLPASRPT